MKKKQKKFIIKVDTSTALMLLVFTGLIFSCRKPVEEENTDYQFNKVYEPIIDSILKQLTLEEKIAMLHGNGKFTSAGVERLNIPELSYTDGPNGVRAELERHSWKELNLTTDSATFFPTGTALAATWNTKLAYKYGAGIGLETRAREKDVLLGPAVNIIRTPVCGRNFEYFTEDPWLNSQIAVGYVKGVQNQDVAACVKHYAANNQEYERSRISVEMSDRALHEIYLPVFKATSEEADAYSMMGAYNKFRGIYLCQNDFLNNKILKNEFGFKGIVISDWGATHNTVEAAMGGLDVEMGTRGTDYDNNYMGLPLRDSVLAGIVPMEVINDKVKRILRVIYNTKKMDPSRKKGEFTTQRISNIAYEIASEAIVLLKNENNLLPLNQNEVKSIAIIGQNAVQPQSFGGMTASVKAKYEVSPLEGIKKKVGDKIILKYAPGYEPNYEKEPEGSHVYPVNEPNQELIDEAVQLAKESEVVILLAGTNRDVETEGQDRRDIQLPFGQNELIKSVTEANKNTIVVVVAGAACDINLPAETAPAMLWSWYNGSEAGNALADVLFGDVNPSGKLPFTIPKKLEDVGAHALDAYPGKDLAVKYKEGILVGYRWFDTKQIEPRYPFGFGLSYTDFDYKQLSISKAEGKINIMVTLENSGKVKGKETVQCYIQDTESSVMRPAKELKAFTKTELKPGEVKTVSLSINKEDLAYFNETNEKWTFEPGEFKVMVGSSSRDIRLEEVINLK